MLRSLAGGGEGNYYKSPRVTNPQPETGAGEWEKKKEPYRNALPQSDTAKEKRRKSFSNCL